MSDTGHIKCPRCGKELPVSAPEGLCPACLGALNFVTETEMPGAEAREALPPLTPHELAPHFPQLEILECLGRGGMGVVYKARQRTLNRLVALKLLAPERVQDAKFADRFAREAQALAALNHPNIVTIHDFGKAGGFYYLLMEFVDGLNLRQLLRSRKLQPAEALAIVPPVCEALQYAHEHGIVHRDIKPENLLLAKDGRVKIADFGIAKMLGTDGGIPSISLSAPGGEGRGEEVIGAPVTQHTTLGTPQYMAPEQRDHSQSADHRADIYSLGVVLYELLTGELPADKLQPPSRVRGVQIDVRLDEIVLRALEKTPALRYQTAGEFKTQVETMATFPAATKPASLLKLARGRYTTPEFLATPIGGLRKHLGLGELSLFSDHLVFTAGDRRTVIPFTALKQLGNSRGPLWTSPVGHEYLSLIYEDNGQPCHLMFMPGEFMFSRAHTTAEAAQEWVLAIQAATQSAGGKPVPVIPDGPQVIPASPWLATLMLVPLLCPLAFAWWMQKYGVLRSAGSSLPNELFRLTILAPLLIIMLGFLAVMVFSARSRFLDNLRDTEKDNGGGFSPALTVVSFYTGMILGLGLLSFLPGKFNRDSSYLLLGTITLLFSPIAGGLLDKIWLQKADEQQRAKRTRILAILAWLLSVPVIGFSIFSFVGLMSESDGWHPARSEALIVSFTWLGSMLLPWAAIRLRDRPAKFKNRVWQFAGLLTLACLSLGFGLRQYEGWQKDARRMGAERNAVALSAPATVDRAVDHSPFIAHLPNGGSVELLAVRLQNTPTNEPWWKPDGTPSSYGGDITMEGMPKSDGGVLGLLKVTWPKTSTNTTDFSMDAGRFALKNGLRQPIEELRIEHFDRAIAINDTTILSLETGVREWQTVMSFKPGLADYIFGGKRRRQWEISETTAGNLKVACSKLFRLPGNEYSLAVIDKKGNRWAPSSFRITTTTGQLEGEYEASFDGIGNENTGRVTLQDVEEIRWQIRPYDSIQFQNVSLQPGKHTQVSINEFVSETTPSSLTANREVPSGGRLELNISNAEVTKQKPLFLDLEKNAKYYAPIPVYFSAAGVVEQTRSATDWLTTNDIDLVSWSVPGMASLSGINLQGSAGVDKLIFDDLQNNPQSDYWSILGWNKNFVYQERTDRERGPSYWILRTAKGKIIMLEVSSSEVNGGQLSIRYRFGKQPQSKENKTQSSNPNQPQSVGSSTPYAVPLLPLILRFLFLALVIGGLVSVFWFMQKKGLKGCLLACAITLGVLLGLVGMIWLFSFGFSAWKARTVHAPAGTTLELRPISQQAPPPQPNGLAMQVQNGFRFKASGAQLVTFEFFMRQGDDRLVPLPQLTARLAMASNYSLESSIYWAGVRGDDARGTNQLWSWSVHAYGQTQQPLPSRPDYETNITYHLRSGEVLNWWQLALPAQVNLMPGAAPQDIPLFRTFGSATLDPKQPKEAIVRVKCEALPAGYQFGREQYELLLGSKVNTFRSVAEGVQTDEFERTVSKEKMTWQKWSKAAVDEARKNGHAVLVDFTADWCLTGQANRKTSIEVKAVREKLDAIGAIALSGDYTKADSAITKELERYKRVGVPLTIIYPANPEAEPIVLPELLTPAAVVEALNKAAQELVGNKP